jgi:hypothetical protein
LIQKRIDRIDRPDDELGAELRATPVLAVEVANR